MSKYEPLAQFLSGLADEKWNASFADVEKVLGFALPKSAYQYPAWWANQSGDGHSQKSGWYDAGWRTAAVDIAKREVVFERAAEPKINRGQAHWDIAREATGIDDQELLERAAVAALIQQEAGKRLADLGGTMPHAKAAPRARSGF